MPFETSRLRVRHFRIEDAPEIYRLSQEASLRRFLPDQVYADEEEARGVLEFLIAQYSEPEALRAGVYVQAVELLAGDELIGHVGLSPAENEREIGYAIAEAHQGLGYATELVRGTTRWAQSALSEASLLGVVASANTSSIRVLEKAGFALSEEATRDLQGAQTLARRYRAKLG